MGHMVATGKASRARGLGLAVAVLRVGAVVAAVQLLGGLALIEGLAQGVAEDDWYGSSDPAVRAQDAAEVRGGGLPVVVGAGLVNIAAWVVHSLPSVLSRSWARATGIALGVVNVVQQGLVGLLTVWLAGGLLGLGLIPLYVAGVITVLATCLATGVVVTVGFVAFAQLPRARGAPPTHRRRFRFLGCRAPARVTSIVTVNARVASGLALILLGTGCADEDAQPAAAADAASVAAASVADVQVPLLAEARETWAASDVDHYRWQYSYGGPDTQYEGTVEVLDGRVTSFSVVTLHSEDGDLTTEDVDPVTVEDVFAEIGREVERGHVTADYAEEDGRPVAFDYEHPDDVGGQYVFTELAFTRFVSEDAGSWAVTNRREPTSATGVLIRRTRASVRCEGAVRAPSPHDRREPCVPSLSGPSAVPTSSRSRRFPSRSLARARSSSASRPWA